MLRHLLQDVRRSRILSKITFYGPSSQTVFHQIEESGNPYFTSTKICEFFRCLNSTVREHPYPPLTLTFCGWDDPRAPVNTLQDYNLVSQNLAACRPSHCRVKHIVLGLERQLWPSTMFADMVRLCSPELKKIDLGLIAEDSEEAEYNTCELRIKFVILLMDHTNNLRLRTSIAEVSQRDQPRGTQHYLPLKRASPREPFVLIPLHGRLIRPHQQESAGVQDPGLGGGHVLCPFYPCGVAKSAHTRNSLSDSRRYRDNVLSRRLPGECGYAGDDCFESSKPHEEHQAPCSEATSLAILRRHLGFGVLGMVGHGFQHAFLTAEDGLDHREVEHSRGGTRGSSHRGLAECYLRRERHTSGMQRGLECSPEESKDAENHGGRAVKASFQRGNSSTRGLIKTQ